MDLLQGGTVLKCPKPESFHIFWKPNRRQAAAFGKSVVLYFKNRIRQFCRNQLREIIKCAFPDNCDAGLDSDRAYAISKIIPWRGLIVIVCKTADFAGSRNKQLSPVRQQLNCGWTAGSLQEASDHFRLLLLDGRLRGGTQFLCNLPGGCIIKVPPAFFIRIPAPPVGL